jgi:hypothetical protein
MDFKRVGLAVAMAFTVGLSTAGCPSERTLGNTCSTDTDCTGEGQVCDPTTLVCVQTCTSASDCETGGCAPLGGGRTESVCTCATDTVCMDAYGSDFVCLQSSPRVCAVSGAGGGDAGTGGGGACTLATDCAYGQYCDTGTCAPVPAATCTNVLNAPAWNPATSNGYVIYNVTTELFGASRCADGINQAVTGRIQFYAPPGSTLPPVASGSNTAANLPGFTYYRTDGTVGNPGGTTEVLNFYNRVSDREGNVRINLCAPTGAIQLPIGVQFENGNPFCATLTK